MTTDEKVALARTLAEALQIKRSEWQRWANYFVQVRDLQRALQFARHLSNSHAMRPDPKRAAARIYQTIQRHYTRLQGISLDDLNEVFGYVGRELEWLSFTQGGSRNEGSSRHAGRESGRRHRSH